MPRALFRYCGVLAAVLLALAVVAPGAPARAQSQDGFVPDEVVVSLFEPADPNALSAAYQLTVLDQFGRRPIYRLRIGDGTPPPQKAKQLLADARVQYAEPNYVGKTPEARQQASWSIGADAGGYQAQWAAPKMRLPEAHTASKGDNVVVALLDTGADLAHPQLRDRWLRANNRVVGYDFVDGDADPSEQGRKEVNHGFGHGTHVAGLVALAAPEAKLMPVRVLDENGAGNAWVLAEALDWAVRHGADVINMSLSTTHRTNLLDKIVAEITCTSDVCAAGDRQGVVIVAAAGNDGGSGMHYPAAEPYGPLISVAASTPLDALAVFSTRGDWVDLMAPGERILSTVPHGAYGTWTGTSMAAPLVAGSVALIRSLCPTMHAFSLATRVVQQSADVGGLIARRADAAATVQAGCAFPAPNVAGDYLCTGAVGAQTFTNIVVPPGMTCTLDGTRALGTIKVGANATLLAKRVRIKGDLLAESATRVVLQRGSAISGNLQIIKGGTATVEGVSVAGNLKLDEQRGALRAMGNTIGGNLQAFKNSGGLTLVSNLIASNLQCTNNHPAPAGNNNSARSKQEQCTGL